MSIGSEGSCKEKYLHVVSQKYLDSRYSQPILPTILDFFIVPLEPCCGIPSISPFKDTPATPFSAAAMNTCP